MSHENKLGNFLREVSNWNWEEFCRAEGDPTYTTNQALIFALVRSCAMEKMEAIKLALNRIDGKLKTPVKIEMPKVYYLFPYATATVPAPTPPVLLPPPEAAEDGLTYEALPDEPPVENDLPSLSLRQTVAKMSDNPRQVPDFIIQYATQTQQWLNGQAEEPIEKPLVKSVVAAHLLAMAQRRDITALNEVFDQIDGKLVETIQILGDDIFITSYALTAPPEAQLNKDGVLQLEAMQAQNMWAQKLGGGDGR